MKKALPWITSVLLIIIGIGITSDSLIGGLFAMLGGLILMPPILNILSSRKQFSFLKTRKWASNVIAISLLILAFLFVSKAQDEKLIAEYNKDPAKVTAEIKKALSEKDYSSALWETKKYLKVLPNNLELKGLLAEAQSVSAANTQKQADKKIDTTKNESSATSLDMNEKSLHDVGICLGIANAYIAFGGELTEPNRKYFANKSQYDSFFKEAFNDVKTCMAGKTDAASHQDCISQLAASKKTIYEGFLKGKFMVNDAHQNKNDTLVGTLVLSCSAMSN